MGIKYLDMFSGIGGFRSALDRVGGFECVGFCEIDEKAKETYEAIYDTKGELYFNDAREINPNALPDIDLICGGFPCQSFSIAGKRGGFEDTRGTLFFEIARIASVKKPKYMLLGGVIGAGITWTVIKSMAQLGPAKAALLIVMSQLIVAYLIELVGLFGVEKEPFSWRKVIGMGIALIGTTIFQWK